MSGYTDSVLQADTGRMVGDAPLIRKPFTQHKLITKVAELLGDCRRLPPEAAKSIRFSDRTHRKVAFGGPSRAEG